MHGYKPTSDPEKASIAMYGERKGISVAVRHAARKVGRFWESKMGQGDTLRHRDADVFENTSYGSLLMYFERYKEDPFDPRKIITAF
jgi:hypothetical protein